MTGTDDNLDVVGENDYTSKPSDREGKRESGYQDNIVGA